MQTKLNKIEKIAPLEVANSLSAYWSPKIISSVNDSYIKVAKLKGEFVWHSHEQEDEMFMVLKGELKLEFRNSSIALQAGECYVVPAGVEHNPIAEEECLVMLIESKATLHTGNVVHKGAKSIEEQLSI